VTAQRSKRNLAKLTKIKIEMLPLIRGDDVRTFGEVILEIEEAVQKTLELMKFADVYAISELVE
jgi:cell fate regulator YaaT (PSP1 superfamily)